MLHLCFGGSLEEPSPMLHVDLLVPRKKTVFKEGMGVYITLYPLHAEDHRSIGKLHMNTIDDTQEIPKY